MGRTASFLALNLILERKRSSCSADLDAYFLRGEREKEKESPSG